MSENVNAFLNTGVLHYHLACEAVYLFREKAKQKLKNILEGQQLPSKYLVEDGSARSDRGRQGHSYWINATRECKVDNVPALIEIALWWNPAIG